jgi:hypothetical protein
MCLAADALSTWPLSGGLDMADSVSGDLTRFFRMVEILRTRSLTLLFRSFVERDSSLLSEKKVSLYVPPMGFLSKTAHVDRFLNLLKRPLPWWF